VFSVNPNTVQTHNKWGARESHKQGLPIFHPEVRATINQLPAVTHVQNFLFTFSHILHHSKTPQPLPVPTLEFNAALSFDFAGVIFFSFGTDCIVMSR
jgi:hypothetical protein